MCGWVAAFVRRSEELSGAPSGVDIIFRSINARPFGAFRSRPAGLCARASINRPFSFLPVSGRFSFYRANGLCLWRAHTHVAVTLGFFAFDFVQLFNFLVLR